MENKKRKITLSGMVSVVLCVAFIPVIIMNIMLIAGSYINPGELPGVLGVKPAVVLTGSMEPVIQTGDMIFIHGTDTDTLKEGDVICYLLSGKAVTHRIVGITNGEDGKPNYITQGDANNVEDRLAVKEEQIQGIWKGGRIGGLGKCIMSMQTPMGMMIGIIFPLLLFILLDVWSRHRADRVQMEQNAREKAELEAELADMKRQMESGEEVRRGQDEIT